jgi:hypothetical protein
MGMHPGGVVGHHESRVAADVGNQQEKLALGGGRVAIHSRRRGVNGSHVDRDQALQDMSPSRVSRNTGS